MVSVNTWIRSAKVVFISAGIISIAAALKVSVPFVLDVSVSHAPRLWSSFRSWLKPPYVYAIINGIIMTIAASSRFQQKTTTTTTTNQSDPMEDAPKILTDSNPVFQYVEEVRLVDEPDQKIEETVEIASGSLESSPAKTFKFYPEVSPGNLSSPAEKPLVSARFSHRKPVKFKSSPEGVRALKVAKPKRQETMENTWKMITEGRAMPLTRHLKKSETWENHGGPMKADESPSPRQMRKSETFKDRTNTYQSSPSPSPSAGKMRKEASLSQDELNRRVEAFIKKFNEEMRLQRRQEALNQCKGMINRASY